MPAGPSGPSATTTSASFFAKARPHQLPNSPLSQVEGRQSSSVGLGQKAEVAREVMGLPKKLQNLVPADTELLCAFCSSCPDVLGAEALKEPRRLLRSSNTLLALLFHQQDKISPTATQLRRAVESYQCPFLYPLKKTQERNPIRGSKRPGLLPSSCVGDLSSSSMTSFP